MIPVCDSVEHSGHASVPALGMKSERKPVEIIEAVKRRGPLETPRRGVIWAFSKALY